MVSARRSALSFSAILAVDLGACGNQSPACCNRLGPGPTRNLPTGLSGTVERRAFSLCASKQKSRGHRKLTCLLTINTPDFFTHRSPRPPPTSPTTDPLSSGHRTPDTESPPSTRQADDPAVHAQGNRRARRPPRSQCRPRASASGPRRTEQKHRRRPHHATTEGSGARVRLQRPRSEWSPRALPASEALLRASTPQTVTREAGRRSTRRPRLQLQATVVYRSRPHQNTKPEPLSAPAAGNRGRPPLHRPCANLASSRRARPRGPGAREGLRLGGSHQASL